MSAADYVGRTVDIACFRGIFPDAKEQLLAQELVSSQDYGAIITGIEKLAQSVLIAFLSITGTKQYIPDNGCQFMLDAQRGVWRTVADVIQSFNLSRVDVRRQIQAQETINDPPDELYGGVTLLGVALSGDTVSVRMMVTSQAGSTYTFITPLTVAIR